MISSGQATPILAGSPQKQSLQRGPSSFFSSPEKKSSVHASPTRGMLMGDGYEERRKGTSTCMSSKQKASITIRENARHTDTYIKSNNIYRNSKVVEG